MQSSWLIIGDNFLLGSRILKILKRKHKAIGVPHGEMDEPERIVGLALFNKMGGGAN